MNKKLILGISVVIIILCLGTIGIKFYNKKALNEDVIKAQHVEKKENTPVEVKESILNFLKVIAGIKANNIEIIDNPVGFKGEFFAPDEAIVKSLNYFLKQTKNNKMENLNIKSEDDIINITVDYNVNKTITTPIELKIKPALNEAEDLVINIEEVKFLDLTIANWIVNFAMDNFVEDWFPKNGDLNIDFNKGNVIIYKDNFKGFEIKHISLKNGLQINIILDLEKLL